MRFHNYIHVAILILQHACNVYTMHCVYYIHDLKIYVQYVVVYSYSKGDTHLLSEVYEHVLS